MSRFFTRSPATDGGDKAENASPAPPEEDLFGLFQLWPDPEVERDSPDHRFNTTVDIIAIHGLGGHPYKTWTEGDKMWLRDFLPKDLPTARIFTYGYNAGVAFTNSTSTLRDFAITLLEKMRQLRRRSADRDALIIAHERQKTYGVVGQSVAGVVFLGTPHRGSNLAFWGAIFSKLADFAVFGRMRTELLQSLNEKSKELGDICSQFVERGIPLQIFTIYERLKVSSIQALVVDESSAILYLPNETPLPMEADHRSMCKFLTSSGQNYILVLDCIMELVDSIATPAGDSVLTGRQAEFVRRLVNVPEEEILRPIPNQWGKTSKWLLEHDEFRSWQKHGNGRRGIWLHGPPGSGKSILAKQVLSVLRSESEKASNSTIIKKPLFFFFDNKDSRRRNSMSFVSSVLRQLLCDPRTAFVIKYIDTEIVESIRVPESLLWECLFSIIRKASGILFQLIIDAFDERVEEKIENRNDILDRLAEFSSNDLSKHLRIMVTDRQPPPYNFAYTVKPEIIDMVNPRMREGVKQYICIQVRSKLEVLGFSTRRGEEIEKRLLQISKGNFLQAILCWRMFDEKVTTWSPKEIDDVLNTLETRAPGLDTYYYEILRAIPMAWRSRARKAFSIILVACEPLTFSQLAYLTLIQEGDNDVNGAHQARFTTFDFNEFLEKYCGHIIKRDENDLVSFTHQSVKDLLSSAPQEKDTFSILGEFQMDTEVAHSLLLDLCLQVFEFEDRPEWKWEAELEKPFRIFEDVLRKFRVAKEAREILVAAIESLAKTPCLLYATRHWATHYREITTNDEIDDTVIDFLQSPSAYYYHQIWEILQDFPSEVIRNSNVMKSRAPLYHVILRDDFPVLVKRLIIRGSDVNMANDAGQISPLTWSILCERKQSFKTILLCKRVLINLPERDGWRPIHRAVRCRDPFFIKLLVKRNRVNVDARGGPSEQTPLIVSIIEKRLDAAIILIDTPGVDLELADKDGKSPYEIALHAENSEKIVRALLEKLDPKRLPNIGALKIASERGWTWLEEKLVQEKEKFVMEKDESGFTPVGWYAFAGRYTSLVWILEKLSPDMLNNETDCGPYNLVSLCAHQGWQDVVQLLRRKFGLRAPEVDHVGRNMLHWAIDHDWELGPSDITQYSWEQLNQQDRDGKTPLHLAVLGRNMRTIRLLLYAGAAPSCLLKDRRGLNPAHLAAESAFRDALLRFLEIPIREFHKTREGASLLHLIACWFDDKLVTKFIEQKRPLIDLGDKHKRTPLHYAATVDNRSAAEALLAQGADVDSRDINGRTPLHDALRTGGTETVLMLLDHGADTTIRDNFSQSCLHICARYGHMKLSRLMLDMNPRIINSGDIFSMTPLHRACAWGDSTLVEMLLELGADWQRRDHTGQTPLEKAAAWGQKYVVEVFVDWLEGTAGVSSTAQQEIVDDALHLAIQEEFYSIEMTLRRCGARDNDKPLKRWRPYMTGPTPENRWPLTNMPARHGPTPTPYGVNSYKYPPIPTRPKGVSDPYY